MPLPTCKEGRKLCMPIEESALHLGIAQYYARKLHDHGLTPQGVDWNGEASQRLRFTQLISVLKPDDFLENQNPTTLNDLGCGYGALLTFLKEKGLTLDYEGIDLSEAMIQAAQKHHGEQPNARFLVGPACTRIADYSVASGIFNVRQDISIEAWQDFIYETLDDLDRNSRHGFSFNCLTSYSDAEKMKPHLHYCAPEEIFRHCKIRYSRQVALLHDYGLYEFTIIVRKQP